MICVRNFVRSFGFRYRAVLTVVTTRSRKIKPKQKKKTIRFSVGFENVLTTRGYVFLVDSLYDLQKKKKKEIDILRIPMISDNKITLTLKQFHYTERV